MEKILRLMVTLCFLTFGMVHASAQVHSATNDQKTTKVYAFNLNQDTFQTGLVSFDLNQPSTLIPIGEEMATMIAAGAGVNDVFYAVSSTGFGPGKASLYSVNTRNGELTLVGQLTENLLDMTYDYSSEIMYGISMNNKGVYTLHTINLLNGATSMVAEFKTPIAAIACDKQGRLYGFGTDGKLYEINKTTADLTGVGAMGITPYSRQSMEFDHTTGKLYLISVTENNYSVLYYVDLTNGNVTELQSYKNTGAFLSALYIPFTVKQEVLDPVTAYTFKKDLNKVVTFDLNSPSTFTEFDKDLSGTIVAGTGANDVLYFIYDEWGYLSLKQLKLRTKQLGGIDPALDMALLDMAYDYTTDTMYGIATEEGISSLYVASLSKVAEKRFDKKGDFNTELVALSCDKAGQLYGLGKDGKLYKINKSDVVLSEVGPTRTTIGAKHAMEFDRATGKLYILTTTAEDYSILYVVEDVTNGVATQLHSYQEAEVSLSSLYIPFTPSTERSVGNLKELKEAGANDLPYQVTGEVLVTGIRTLENSTVFYVEDATAAIAVNYTSTAEFPYQPGDKLKDLKGKLVANGSVHSLTFESASKASGGNTVVPAILTVTEINAGYPANEAKFIRVENALVSKENETYVLIQDGNKMLTTGAESELQKREGQAVVVTGHVESAIDGLVMLSLDKVEDYIDASDFIRLSYGSGISSGGKGSASQANMAAAIQFPAEKISQYAHNKITKIRLHLTLGHADDLKIFITRQLSGPYTYEQTVSTPEIGWNEVILDTPYEIGEEEIFIGYEVNGTGALLMGTYGNSSNVLGDWYRIGESEWKHLSDDNWKKVMAIEAIVQGDNLPKTDVELQKVILTRYPKLNQKTSLSGTVLNKAAEMIQSLEVSYEINGKTQKNTITGLSIPYGATGDFIDPEFRVNEEGEWDVKVIISKVNGKEDLNPEDNIVVKQVFCKETFEPRHVLLEIFSTENCSNCPQAHSMIEELLKNYDGIIKVGHHSAFGFDKFTIPASQEYEVFFGYEKGVGTYAPSLMMDRCNMADFGALGRDNEPSVVPVMSTSSDLKRIIEESVAVPAYASIDLKVDTTELPKLKIIVSGKSLLPIPEDSSRVNIYITEDDIFSETQAGASGKWFHQHVLRENLTNFRGDPVDLDKGFEMEYTTEIAEEWNKNRLNVVAFVANYDSDDVNNCVVYNSAEFSLYDRKAVTGIEEVTVFPKVYVWGNKLYLNGTYIQAELYNCKGEKVATAVNRNEVDLCNLNKGVYIVRVMTKENVKSFKIII